MTSALLQSQEPPKKNPIVVVSLPGEKLPSSQEIDELQNNDEDAEWQFEKSESVDLILSRNASDLDLKRRKAYCLNAIRSALDESGTLRLASLDKEVSGAIKNALCKAYPKLTAANFDEVKIEMTVRASYSDGKNTLVVPINYAKETKYWQNLAPSQSQESITPEKSPLYEKFVQASFQFSSVKAFVFETYDMKLMMEAAKVLHALLDQIDKENEQAQLALLDKLNHLYSVDSKFEPRSLVSGFPRELQERIGGYIDVNKVNQYGLSADFNSDTFLAKAKVQAAVHYLDIVVEGVNEKGNRSSQSYGIILKKRS